MQLCLSGLKDVDRYVEKNYISGRSLKAPLHQFGQKGLDLPARSLTDGYLIKSALN